VVDARRRAVHQLVEDWLALPAHRSTNFTTLEMRIQALVADAVAQAVQERDQAVQLALDDRDKARRHSNQQAEEIARLTNERDGLAFEMEGWKQKNRRDNEYLLGDVARLRAALREIDEAHPSHTVHYLRDIAHEALRAGASTQTGETK
jgi:hypothetical protein